MGGKNGTHSIIKKINKALFFLEGLASILLLSACGTTEMVYYEHQPSEAFYSHRELSAPELKNFTADGILFTVDVNAAMLNKYFLWLGVYTLKEGADITIEKASVFNGENELARTFNLNLLLDEDITGDGFYQNQDDTLKLFELNNDYLEKSLENEISVTLKVFYVIEGKRGVMEFTLDRRVEKQVVYPT
ncbi:hypothetical protein ACUN9Y_02430 [Halomonas sp. V046]|uniref:hypothetical protein n=1 Tax=Halomonas sp. V046 TaxID=3459611 RepID=UPI004044F583